MNAPIRPREPRFASAMPSMARPNQHLDFAERVALFICGMKTDTASLLEQFAREPRRAAEAFAAEMTAAESATRQGRLIRELGIRADACQRLRELLIEAPVGLRHAICQAIPPRLAPHFPCVAHDENTAPAMRQLALRLVLEAIR